MKSNSKFSKDPKIKLTSIKEFLEKHNYFIDINKSDLWNENKRPSIYSRHYKFTSDKLIYLSYSVKRTCYGTNITEKLEYIQVAIRDGVTEYELLNEHLFELRNYKKEHKYSKKIDESINNLTRAMKLLPKFKVPSTPTPQRFDECIIETGYKTPFESLKNKYVVFDVETNGTRTANDDLLSLSIYDPTTGICYNKLFPLDLQPLVLTSWIHGITDNHLSNSLHFSQSEIDHIIDFFHLNDRTLLSFSGGKGNFDSTFLINYCKRHNLCGFEGLQYENIKSMLPSVGYGFEGQMTKDNLCRLFGIDGVQQVHSSQNDCILEWKLFEKIQDKDLFFIDNHLYNYNDGYIVPISYLSKNPELAKFAKINVPYINAHCTEIYKYKFPKKIVEVIKKFPTNITGIALENGIYAELNIVEQDNFKFLMQNKQNINYIGSLESNIKEIPVEIQKDGTIKSLDSKNDGIIEEVNEITKLVIENLKGTLDYIKTKIFKDEQIVSQELCITDDKKVLALCDLSSQTKVLEIKTKPIPLDGAKNIIDDSLVQQLYYESKGRDVYLLSIDIDINLNRKGEPYSKSVSVSIYNVSLIKQE